ncbi:HAMP domain-containing histidine kinase [Yinghuangia sp. KLBMP8922]|uniref:histidine kinase n=1 Tax=Yinghuangia soli TaxID=2908204 RepID=A0AA41Q7Z3_9ACTN|nr:HAMP domain-containing histidine kinase [Yinghuangia soli]
MPSAVAAAAASAPARRRRPLSLRARLTLVYGGLFMLAGVLLLGLTYVLVSQQFDSPPGDSKMISGVAPDGRPLPPEAVTLNEGDRPRDDPPGGAPPGAVTNQHYAEQAQNDVMGSLLTQGAIALGVVGAISGALGWLIAGRVLQPLHRVTETARRIADAPAADRGLHERIALPGPADEVKVLADTFDVMLARLDHAFDGQRRFIANASHELRTPLSLNKALLEVAVRGAEASVEVRQLGTTLLDINARHERLIDGLLLLARSEAEVLEQAYVDLADVVEHVADLADAADSESAAEVKVVTAADEAPTTGNPVLLERLVQNLVENGVRHNTPNGGWVRVACGPGDVPGTVVLEVSNTGPVVAPYDIPTLFEPFRRLGADRLSAAPGAGLGLSIVRAVARAHGGDVRAEPRESGGLVVTVTLPAAV